MVDYTIDGRSGRGYQMLSQPGLTEMLLESLLNVVTTMLA